MAFKVTGKDGAIRRAADKTPIVGSLFSGWEIKSDSFKEDPQTGERRFRAVASTSSRDREQDIILTNGFFWGTNPKNDRPLVPGLFGHNYYSVPVFRVEDLQKSKTQLTFTACFPKKGESALADEVYQAYQDERLFGFSVGFRPVKAEGLTVGLLRELGMLSDIDQAALPDDTWVRGFLYREQELLEISAVPVPANAEATALVGRSFGISQEMSEYKGLMVPKGMFQESGDLGVVFDTQFQTKAAEEEEKPEEEKPEEEKPEEENTEEEELNKPESESAPSESAPDTISMQQLFISQEALKLQLNTIQETLAQLMSLMKESGKSVSAEIGEIKEPAHGEQISGEQVSGEPLPEIKQDTTKVVKAISDGFDDVTKAARLEKTIKDAIGGVQTSLKSEVVPAMVDSMKSALDDTKATIFGHLNK